MAVVISSDLVLTDTESGGGTINANNPLIGYENRVTANNVSTDTAASGFPASNLANPSTNLRWKGVVASPAVDEHIELDLQTAELVDYIAVARHNFGSAEIPVSVEAHQGVDDYTKSLLHFDGANASTTFTDETGKTWTANGDAQLDTAKKKIGTASGLFDGGGDYISTPDHADFALGSGDFTIDFWFQTNSAGSTFDFLVDQSNGTPADSRFAIFITSSDNLRIEVYQGSSTVAVNSTSEFTNSTNTGWHHAALVRDGGTLRLFIDGTEENTTSISGAINDSTLDVAIGARSTGSNAWPGWIDEFRLSVGIARWTEDFTPPVAPHPWETLISETLLPDDGPALFRFTPQGITKIRLRLQPGTAAPACAVVYCGKLLVVQRRIHAGHTPIDYGRETNVVNGRAENGHFLGRIVTGQRTGTQVALGNLRPAWYRDNIEPFLKQAQENPFFWAWRPDSYPNEVGYAWLTNDPQPEHESADGRMQVTLEMAGVV